MYLLKSIHSHGAHLSHYKPKCIIHPALGHHLLLSRFILCFFESLALKQLSHSMLHTDCDFAHLAVIKV